MNVPGVSSARTSYRKGGPAPRSRDLNAIARYGAHARGEESIEVNHGTAGGLVISYGGIHFAGKKCSFGLTIAGVRYDTVRVYPGRLNVHGLGSYVVPETLLTLTCGPDCYVYVEATRGSYGTNSIQQSADWPESDATYLRVPLYHFTWVAERTRYVLTRVHHCLDINLDAPLR